MLNGVDEPVLPVFPETVEAPQFLPEVAIEEYTSTPLSQRNAPSGEATSEPAVETGILTESPAPG